MVWFWFYDTQLKTDIYYYVNFNHNCFSSDFSGRCGPRQMQGYATKTEYEMLGEGVTKETPQNKFNRLQHEIRELAEELEQIKVCLKQDIINSEIF